ncbi:MAG TPA: hypothetical protein VIK65_02530 [Candidatus Limnocylindrales bacterium]
MTIASATGLPVSVARAAADAGAAVQLIGKVGEGPDGDAVLLDVAAAGIGHVAVLRDAEAVPVADTSGDDGRTDVSIDQLSEIDEGDDGNASRRAPRSTPILEAADLELALRYLPEYSVVVVAEPLDADALRAVVAAAGWGGARLVVIGAGDDLPDDATVLEAPDDDAESAFADAVGRYAAALDRGVEPREAFAAASTGAGWEPVRADG